MKRAFTLIEMMIVVAILVTLMTITFKLSTIGQDAEKRTCTMVRLQRLENCLSGYYAAFGNYPPVKLHGSRDITMIAEGDQQSETDQHNQNWAGWKNIGDTEEKRAWQQVKLACRAQPIDCRYPFPSDQIWKERIDDLSEMMKAYAHEEVWDSLDADTQQKIDGGFEILFEGNLGQLKGIEVETEWKDIKIFKFGVMSFLLPRYIIMTGGPAELYRGANARGQGGCAQWSGNNDVPSDPLTGRTNFGLGDSGDGWQELWNTAQDANNIKSGGRGLSKARLANIPSQAACARWIPNLEGICDCTCDDAELTTLFGINIKSTRRGETGDLDFRNVGIQVYRPKGSAVGRNQYLLDGVTVRDGWGEEFYYYSPAPYQRYTLWSSGPNQRTFPPWISRSDLKGDEPRCVGLWTADDIIQLSH